MSDPERFALNPLLARLALQATTKAAIQPPPDPAAAAAMGGAPPPGAPPAGPAMGAAPGMPPVDPAAMGAAPGMPPMDPAALGLPPGDPAAGGAPAPAGGGGGKGGKAQFEAAVTGRLDALEAVTRAIAGKLDVQIPAGEAMDMVNPQMAGPPKVAAAGFGEVGWDVDADAEQAFAAVAEATRPGRSPAAPRRPATRPNPFLARLGRRP